MNARLVGRIAWIGTICGTLLWFALVSASTGEPDGAHPVRYAHRHVVRYVSEDMNLALNLVFGTTFVLFLIGAGCKFGND
jgi:hypothetical protein